MATEMVELTAPLTGGSTVAFLAEPVGPGLYVNRDPMLKGKWAVTHISGLRVSAFCRSRKEARALAERLLPLADWTQPKEVLMNVPSLKQDVLALRHEMGLP